MSLGGLFFLFMLSPFSLSTACPVLALHLILNICTKISLKRDKKWMSYQFSKLFIDSGQSYSLGHFRPLRQDLLLLGHPGTNANFVSTPVYRALCVTSLHIRVSKRTFIIIYGTIEVFCWYFDALRKVFCYQSKDCWCHQTAALLLYCICPKGV